MRPRFVALQAHGAWALRSVALAALLLIFPVTARAGWSDDGVPLGGTSHSHGRANLWSDPDAGLIVAWQSWGGGAGWIIRAARLTDAGNPIPNWDQDNPPQYATSAIPDGLGGLYRTSSFPAGGGPIDRNVQLWRVQASGGLASGWPAAGLTVAGTSAREDQGILAGDGTGGVIVAYVEYPGFAVVAKHVLGDGTFDGLWPPAGRTLNTPDNLVPVLTPVAMPDGAGGAFVAWGSPPVRAQRVTAAGQIAAGWPADGLVLSTNPLPISGRIWMIPSGPQHVLGSWAVDEVSARGIWVQRFHVDGTVAAGWPATGVRVANSGAEFQSPITISDGADGAMVAWHEGTTVRGARVLANGSLAAGWPSTGRDLLDAGAVMSPSLPGYPAIASGPDGGFIVCWDDLRRPGHYLVRARWLLGDGSADPSQPDSGRAVSPSATRAFVRGATSDGAGGLYVAWQEEYPEFTWYEMKVTWVPYPGGTVDVPRDRLYPALRLSPPWPNPAVREFSVRFTLDHDGPARIELLDVAGRRVRHFDISGAGENARRFDRLDELAAGVYEVTLTQGAVRRSTRVAIVR